jgi:hypothetical protein
MSDYLMKCLWKGVADTEQQQDAADRIEELEAKLAKAVEGLNQCQDEIDGYIRQEYPQDNSLHERYRMRDFSANPARVALAAQKGQDDE